MKEIIKSCIIKAKQETEEYQRVWAQEAKQQALSPKDRLTRFRESLDRLILIVQSTASRHRSALEAARLNDVISTLQLIESQVFEIKGNLCGAF